MGCGASAEPPVHPVAVAPSVAPVAPVQKEEKEEGPPPGGYTEKWPELCDPDKEFNLMDYVFCLPEKKGCVATMLMAVDPKYPHANAEDIRTWKWTIDKDWSDSDTKKIAMVAPKQGARDRKCDFHQDEFNGKVAFTSNRFFCNFHITEEGMEFRNRKAKEADRALLVHRSLDLDGNVFWKSDGHLVDELHEKLFTVAQWNAETETLEVDGREVGKVTANEYMCPDFFLACYFCIHGEPELCDYVLDSAKAQAERAAINKRAAEANAREGRDMHKELREMHAAREAEREKEKRAAAAARKAPAVSAGGGGGSSGPPPAAKWWVCQKCGWKFYIKPFQGKCTVSRGQTCGGVCVQT